MNENTVSNKKSPPDSFNKLINEIAKIKEKPYNKGLFTRKYSKYSNLDYSIEEIKNAINNLDVELMRKISNYFYESSSSYKRIIDHFTGMFLYYYHLTLKNTDSYSKDEILKKYIKALNYLDNLCANGTLRDIVTEVMISGVFYGFINFFKDQECVLTILDPKYCRTRFKSPYNTDVVEFNVTYFLTISDEEELQKVLNRMPQSIQDHFDNWEKGEVISPWINFPPETACAFFMDSADGIHCPPVFDTIIDIMNFNDEKEMEIDKDAQQLEKLLVQRFKLDENGDLELFLEELAEIQKATAAMFKENKYVDVLTTIAEQVEMIDSRSSNNNSSATNNNIIKMMLPKYENAGLSSEIFYATTATSLNLSILNATSFVGKLNEKISTWLSVFLLGNISFGKMRPEVEILPVTWYNKEKMVSSYLSAAQNGYSKMLPYIANGGKQSCLLSSLIMENDILNLKDKLIPLSTSYTQSGINENTGRKELPDEEKTEETVRTSDERGEIRNA